jgi:hypothetical protein
MQRDVDQGRDNDDDDNTSKNSQDGSSLHGGLRKLPRLTRRLTAAREVDPMVRERVHFLAPAPICSAQWQVAWCQAYL